MKAHKQQMERNVTNVHELPLRCLVKTSESESSVLPGVPELADSMPANGCMRG